MKKYFKNCVVIIVCIIISSFGAALNGERVNQKNVLLELDRAVSNAAANKGILSAFYPYLTDISMLFPLTGHPLAGKQDAKTAIEKAGVQKLYWEPLLCVISSTDDLGYTHGRFKKAEGFGYYFTIWRKIKGQWKLAVSQGLIDLKEFSTSAFPQSHRLDIAKAPAVTRAVWDNELAFSRYSVEHGVAKAFYEFMADDGMALSSSRPPNTRDVYKKIMNRPAGERVLQWKPYYSFVSQSGDMAYNFGPYIHTSNTKTGNKQHSYGYFVTVWKKQSDGHWTFLIDGGNTSPPHEEL